MPTSNSMFPERTAAFHAASFRGRNKADITGGPGTIGLCSLQEAAGLGPRSAAPPTARSRALRGREDSGRLAPISFGLTEPHRPSPGAPGVEAAAVRCSPPAGVPLACRRLRSPAAAAAVDGSARRARGARLLTAQLPGARYVAVQPGRAPITTRLLLLAAEANS
ncbi:hypothetical protein EYF80_044694 [Liparis tanakae]|uniref:Uncharacterized protein n=1 Tax=Liparis tanakae TaxID=230148 RepID=A0A4Z2FXQ0_9TELE|nr:hypothetical protein EYF80_044694 [Liparis tanakae]